MRRFLLKTHIFKNTHTHNTCFHFLKNLSNFLKQMGSVVFSKCYLNRRTFGAFFALFWATDFVHSWVFTAETRYMWDWLQINTSPSATVCLTEVLNSLWTTPTILVDRINSLLVVVFSSDLLTIKKYVKKKNVSFKNERKVVYCD